MSIIPQPVSRRAFTLLELLASMAVLCIILSILFQTSRQVLSATRTSHAQMEAAQATRAVLDTLGADLSSRVGSANETVFAAPQGANSELVFFNRSRGPSSSSNFRFLAVNYQLSGSQVLRNTQVVAWDTADPSSAALSVVSSTNTDILASSIVRFEIVAVLNNGSLVPLPSASAAWTTGTWQGTALTHGLQALQLSAVRNTQNNTRVRALIVAIAALDSQSHQLLGKLNLDLAGKLPAAASGQTPLDAWNDAIAKGQLGGIPPAVVSALQLSQQIYPLETP